MIFQIDKTIYEQLSETERYIVDFISQNEDKISYLSITNIADKTFSSSATVSRTIQKCGFKGIAELRYLISKEDKDKSKNVSPYAINKLLDKVYQESTQTIENIPIPAILKAIDHINNAEKIFIYARAFTAMFAEHFQIPLRTVEEWEAGRRKPPEYIPRLIKYQILYEQQFGKQNKKEHDDTV